MSCSQENKAVCHSFASLAGVSERNVVEKAFGSELPEVEEYGSRWLHFLLRPNASLFGAARQKKRRFSAALRLERESGLFMYRFVVSVDSEMIF